MQKSLLKFFKESESQQSKVAPEEKPPIPIAKIEIDTKDTPNGKEKLIRNNRIALKLIGKTQFDRKLVNKLYNGLGVEYENKEGVKGFYKKRMATLQQYFTPTKISELLVKLLQIPENATVLDNCCGSGRMFYHVPNKRLITGIEVEEKACSIAKALYPDACIIHDDAQNHVFSNNFDYCLFNPPFTLQWYIRNGLENVGYQGSVLSHLACLEIGIKAVKPEGYFAAILPANVFKLDATIKLDAWMQSHATEVIRIELPHKVFLRANFPTAIFIFKKATWHYSTRRLRYEKFEYKLESLTGLNEILEEFQEWDGFRDVCKYAESRTSTESMKITPKKPEKLKKRRVKILPLLGCDEARVGHNGNALSLRPNGLIAQLKIANVLARNNPRKWDRYLKRYISEIPKIKSLNEIWSSGEKLEDHSLVLGLQSLNVRLTFDPQTVRYIEKKRRWFRRQVVPFEQQIQEEESADWKEIYAEEGVRTVLNSEYEVQKRNLLKLAGKYPFIKSLYSFQFDDIVRASLKDSVLDASQMGLGKTRKALILALLRNVKHTLIILPRRLFHEWEKEIKILNKDLPLKDHIKFKIIEQERDCKKLSKFNIISRYTIAQKPWYKRSNVLFADKLKRRFKMIIVDEAHAFSKKTTKRTKAIRKMKTKYWLFLTGTPIRNMVDNIWSLFDILFKAGTPLFPYNTSEFRKSFVTVEWVTPEYDNTLAGGRTSQKLPAIKNEEEFKELIKYMMIRRVKSEPQVVKDIPLIEPILETLEFVADEEHWEVYRKHLDYFAYLFRIYLHPELREHERVDTSIILAQLQNLQFVSTIPQHPRFDALEPDYRYKAKLTVVQRKVIEMVRELYRTEKILVVSQRPYFCKFMQKQLRQRGIKSGLHTGQENITKRDKIRDEFERSNQLNILLCTIETFKEGINLPTGTYVIFADLDWTYQKLQQAYSRVLRPQTKKRPTVIFMYYKGFIDEYQWQHVRAKKSAVLSGIDHRKDVENVKWEHWKSITYRMLKELGYDLSLKGSEEAVCCD